MGEKPINKIMMVWAQNEQCHNNVDRKKLLSMRFPNKWYQPDLSLTV